MDIICKLCARALSSVALKKHHLISGPLATYYVVRHVKSCCRSFPDAVAALWPYVQFQTKH